MKIRSGFVSNSSSSSFVIIVDKEVHNEVVKRLSPSERAVINEISENKKVFGQELFIIGEAKDRDGNSSLFYDGLKIEGFDDTVEDEVGSGPCHSDALYEYMKIVEKQPKDKWFKWEADL